MIEWNDRYKVGVERIDDQHKALFAFTNAIEESIRNGWQMGKANEAVQYLVDYARLHFRHEEDCMFRYKCPIAGVNKDAHAQFLAAIEDFQRKLESSPGWDLLSEIHEFLQSWLVKHICKIDVQLRPNAVSSQKD